MAVQQLELELRPPLTVEELDTLAREEGWDEDTRLELLDGELVWMNPINDPHAGCVNRLNDLLRLAYPRGLVLLSVQNPIRASDYDLPQPDLALLRPRADYYSSRKPNTDDVLLLVEVSDTTLNRDLGRKARIYASAGIAEYWVVDLNNRKLYVHRAPANGAFSSRQVLDTQAQVSAEFAPEVELQVADLLG